MARQEKTGRISGRERTVRRREVEIFLEMRRMLDVQKWRRGLKKPHVRTYINFSYKS